MGMCDVSTLLNAARSICEAGDVIMLTGFPCCTNNPLTPQETDGPCGVATVAKAVYALGANLSIVIEEPNKAPVEACVNSLLERSETERRSFKSVLNATDRTHFGDNGRVCVETFPCEWTKLQALRIEEMLGEIQDGHMISLERAGPGKDGVCYTMTGRAVSRKHLAPLHEFFEPERLSSRYPKIKTTAIGDGGNEVGMGRVEVLNAIRGYVDYGDRIACVIPCDNLIVSSVSNWGGYALAAAICLVAASKGAHHPSEETLNNFLGTEEDAACVLEACFTAGAWDGVFKAPGRTVDSFSFEANLAIFREIRDEARKYLIGLSL